MPNQHITNVRSKSFGAELREQLRSQITQPGGDPSLLLTLLAQIIETEAWKTEGQHSFIDYICRPYPEGGLGWGIPAIQTILQLKHTHEDTMPDLHERLQNMRQAVDRLLAIPARKNGRPRKIEQQNSDVVRVSQSTFGNSRADTLARLQRDRPDLAEKVLSGMMSANAAAITAGFRKRSISVFPDDLHRTVAVLKRHFDAEALRAVINALLDTDAPSD